MEAPEAQAARRPNWLARRRLIGIIALAALLRAWAVLLLPVDYDEPVYVGAALDYARALRAGDLGAAIDYPGNREHPALVKLLYAGGALALGDRADPTSVLYSSRAVAAIFGAIGVAAVAWAFGPIAAAMLAVHTLAVKYSGQAYLESVPMALMLVALGAAERWRRSPERGWLLWLSAATLGLAAAGKLTYPLILAPALLALLLLPAGGAAEGGGRPPARVARLPLYALIAAAAFLAANPTLWHDPAGRLAAMAGFHAGYSQGADVQEAAYPWFQPLLWLGTSAASVWHPDVFFYYGFDSLIFLLALGGLPEAWRDPARRWLAVGLAGGVLLLLLWPTKWPQYALPLVPVVCALAGSALRRLYIWLRDLNDYWGWMAEMLPQPPRITWVVLSLFVAFIAGVYGYSLASVAIGGIGWSQLRSAEAALPAGEIYDVLALPDGRVALAADGAVAIWQAPAAAGSPATWHVLRRRESPLPGGRSLALALGPAGDLWIGTDEGLARYGADGWEVYRGEDLGLSSSAVHALALGGDGRLWVGTAAGAAVRSAGGWSPLPEAGPGLILAVAVEPRPAGDVIWFGGGDGVRRLDTASGGWQSFGRESGFGDAGVSAILPDSAGRVWAATLGDGLGLWEGAGWRWMTTANSGLPSSIVTALAETSPGELWVGTGEPLDVGGGLARYDGAEWRSYLPRNSGFSGAEPLAIALDAGGRLWVGTRTAGVSLYQLPP